MKLHIYKKLKKLKKRVRTLERNVISALERLEGNMTPQFESLKQEVERNRSVTQSAITLIGGLAQQIEALKENPDRLQELANDLRSQSDSLAAAITMNTPGGEPSPSPAPAPSVS